MNNNEKSEIQKNAEWKDTLSLCACGCERKGNFIAHEIFSFYSNACVRRFAPNSYPHNPSLKGLIVTTNVHAGIS